VVHQAIAWLGQRETSSRNHSLVSEPISLPFPGTWSVVASPRIAPPIAAQGSVAPDAPGIYALTGDDTRQLFAVNLDPAEADLSAWPTPDDFQKLSSLRATPSADPAAAAIPPSADEKQVWWWLLAAALFLLAGELALANRTVP
jgi:hypothetical protein